MTLRTWLLDTANGTTATAANIVATDATAATQAASGVGTFTNSSPHAGVSCLRWPVSAGASSVIARLPLPAANVSAAFEFYHRATALPAQDTVIFTGRHASGIAVRIGVRTDGSVRLYDSVNATIATTAAGAWAINRWNRISLVATVATSTTGSASLKVYNVDGLTPTGTASGSAANLGTAAFSACDIGVPGTGPTGGWTADWDSLQMNNGATSEIGPYIVANAAPVVSLTANQNVPAASAVSVTATATDDGSVATYAWSGTRYTSTAAPVAITFTGGITNTATVGYASGAAGSLDILQCVVTDNLGLGTTTTTEVRVLSTGTVSTLQMDGYGDSGYTIIGGSATEGAALADGSSSTRVESPDISSTSVSHWWRFAPMTPRTGLRITLSDIVLTASATNSNKVRVLTALTPTSGTQVTQRNTSTLKKVTDDTTSDVTTSDLALYFDLTPSELTATDFASVAVGTVTVV